MTAPKVIFMGTPELARTVLEKLITSRTYIPSLVITQPDKPIGRKHILTPSPVKVCADAYGIPTLQPQKMKDPVIIERIKAEKPDVIIVAAYGKIIPKEIIDIPPHGILNIHVSLLPRYRGASPAHYAILSGDATTGVTIMRIDEGLDTGPIISQQEIAIAPHETTQTLLEKLSQCGGDLLLATLPDWLAGKIKQRAQDHARATLTKILSKEDGAIHADYSAEYIERMTRAFAPWPSAYMKLLHKDGKEMMLKIIHAHISPCTEHHPPLTLFLSPQKELCLATKEHCLMLETVQPEGKNPMSGYAFWLGYQHA